MQDIDDALASGTLRPLPTGTTGWRVTWHKFKELFRFYYFGVKVLAVEHRRLAATIRSYQKEERSATWREREFVQTYRADLLKHVLSSLESPSKTDFCFAQVDSIYLHYRYIRRSSPLRHHLRSLPPPLHLQTPIPTTKNRLNSGR